jgi:hypothetical protein
MFIIVFYTHIYALMLTRRSPDVALVVNFRILRAVGSHPFGSGNEPYF